MQIYTIKNYVDEHNMKNKIITTEIINHQILMQLGLWIITLL